MNSFTSKHLNLLLSYPLYFLILIIFLNSGFTAGGGFSNIYETPIWQKSAVNDYFSHIEALAGGNYTLLPYVNSTTTRMSKSYPYSNYNGKGRGKGQSENMIFTPLAMLLP